jgi:quaternary ammonium compound-resistance protein SugE
MVNWLSWFYLILAAVFEAIWTYCLKLMQFKHLKQLNLSNFFVPNTGLTILAPFAGYIIFGIANVFFFSLATRQIPLATAFAVWTGASLLFIKICEVVFFHQKTSGLEILFMMMIMTGIIGLKFINVKVT